MNLEDTGSFLKVPRKLAWSEIASSQLANGARLSVRQTVHLPEAEAPHRYCGGAVHRVLPCPGLLLSDLYAAWSMGIEPAVFLEFATCPTKENGWGPFAPHGTTERQRI